MHFRRSSDPQRKDTLEHINKYPIKGVAICGSRTWLIYNDGSCSAGVWWRDKATALDYVNRINLPVHDYNFNN